MNRRHFLKHCAAMAGTSLLSVAIPRWCAWAQTGQARPHFFMFIFASGGWDPTMVFEIKPGLPGIDVDPNAVAAISNGITYFHSDQRPWVKRFFDDFGAKSCVINGLDTHSVSHSVGTEIMLTGSAGTPKPDWPTIVAQLTGSELMLPHMALSGPSFSGTLGAGTSSGSGFLELLLNDGSYNPPSATAEAVFDQYRERRFHTLMDGFTNVGRYGLRTEEMDDSYRRFTELKNVRTQLGDEFRSIDGLGGEGLALSAAFERGFAITGTMQARASWDSHSNNFGQQNQGFNNTFEDLHIIVSKLSSKPATSGTGTLLDQTTVVVMSEMGRTPKLNTANGKDHWPVTSVLVVGAGAKGGRVVGATDDFQNGQKVDYATGLVSDTGQVVSAASLGAGLLSMTGLDPHDFLPATVSPFTAFIG